MSRAKACHTILASNGLLGLDELVHMLVADVKHRILAHNTGQLTGFNVIIFFGKYYSQCLKITEKVVFNIASEASYVYILSGQNGPIWRVFENSKLAVKQSYQTGQF